MDNRQDMFDVTPQLFTDIHELLLFVSVKEDLFQGNSFAREFKLLLKYLILVDELCLVTASKQKEQWVENGSHFDKMLVLQG